VGIFTLLVLSRYYYGVLALMPLMSVGGRFRRRVVAGGQLAVFLVFFLAVNQGAGWHSGYSLLNVLLAVYFSGVIGTLAYGQLRAGLLGREPSPEFQKNLFQIAPVAVSVLRGGQRPKKASDRTDVQTK
jgi:hypothetical protein